MALLQIIWNGGELFNDIVGTRDIAVFLTGALFGVCGIALSWLVPDAKLPSTLVNQNIAGTKRRVLVGVIVTALFLRLFGGAIAAQNITLFISFALGVGFMNYHLTGALINIITKAVGSAIPAQNNGTDGQQPK